MLFILISIIVISIVGTLSHFLYDILNHNKFVGLFASVNESTWEHIKIALTPSIFLGVVDGYIYGASSSYFLAKFISLISIIVLMPLLYYGYKYVFIKDNAIVNIMIFYIVVICSQYLFFYLVSIDSIAYFLQYISCIGTYVIVACYILFTLMPIKNFLFKDPISSKYGFKAHR